MSNKPWLNEPDNEEMPYKGYNCEFIRNPMIGNWCGYIGVSFKDSDDY